MKLTLPKWGFGSPLGLPKLQSLIVKVKTPCIEVFFMSLESHQSVNDENGFAWAIWTSATHIMAKRRVTKKSRINSTLVHAGVVRYTIGKL